MLLKNKDMFKKITINFSNFSIFLHFFLCTGKCGMFISHQLLFHASIINDYVFHISDKLSVLLTEVLRRPTYLSAFRAKNSTY